MKIALVFDDLIQFGGAEKLLLAVHEIWPEAPIFTPVASKKWEQKCKTENIKLTTSFMQKLPFKEKLNRVYAVLFLHVIAFERFDFSEYDIVLSISARFAHGVITKPSTKHICYMNSPGRMFWEPENYFDYEKHKKLLSTLLIVPLAVFRIWDYIAAHRVDCFIANSKTPQTRILKYYGRTAKIIYPYADTAGKKIIGKKSTKTAKNPKTLKTATNVKYAEIDNNYFLLISRLVPWKRIDIAIEACGKLGVQVKIVGDGPDRERLTTLISTKAYQNTCELLGYVSEEKKYELLANCKALIITQHEDFGITAVEAMSFGKPVIAYGKGGVLETVIPGITGEFFPEQSAESLSVLLDNFNLKTYDASVAVSQARKFSKAKFKTQVEAYVNSVYLENGCP